MGVRYHVWIVYELGYKISSDIKIHKVYFPNVSPVTASSVECFYNNISSYLYKTN